MEIALEANILDMKEDDGVIVIETTPSDLIKTKELLESKGINEFLSSEVSKIAKSKINLDEATKEKLDRLIDLLEDNDDVQNVHHNAK